MVQIELFNHLLRIIIIIISYLKSFSCVQIIYILLEDLIIELLILNSNTWNHLTMCKQMINI